MPTATLAGPLFAKIIAPWIKVPAENPMADEFADHRPNRSLPGFWLTIGTILLPVVLMLVGSWADSFAPKGTRRE